MIRGDCNTCVHKDKASYSATCVECGIANKNYKPITNADRIRSLSDEELAYCFAANECGYCHLKEKCFSMEPIRDCEDMWLDWLKSPVEVEK